MKQRYKYPVDYSTALLSAFDIGNTLIMDNLDLTSSGIQNDVGQLTDDLKTLENDYRRACEKS
ncbi:MAG TPA: hypothetical protein VLG49_06455 [Rhabdochlamydiaceae bacterium]|nr:hypothetical protein [Rhabdochlamydiaceae bacterium]